MLFKNKSLWRVTPAKFVLSASALMLILVACGGGGGDTPQSSSASNTGQATVNPTEQQAIMQQLENEDDLAPEETRKICKERNNDSFKKLLGCVTLDGVRKHQLKLHDIGLANGGTRVSGSLGFDQSADYAEKVFRDAGYNVTRQNFQFQSFIEFPGTSLTRISPTPTQTITTTIMSYSGSSSVTATVSVLPTVTGCNTADFAGFPAGNIALISRGACTFATKATNAQAAGASAAVIYNNIAGPLNGTLGAGFTLNFAVTAVLQTVGQQLAAIPGLVLSVNASTFRGSATTSNIIAETPQGNPDNVFFTYDGDNSDGVGAGPGPEGSFGIEKTFEAFYGKRGVSFKGTDFDGRSDYGPFIRAGIAAGGLFTGAEGLKTTAEAEVCLHWM